MKKNILGALLDLLIGTVSIAVVFLFVRYADLSDHILVLAVAIVYFLAGLARTHLKDLPLVVRAIIISLFGIIYIPIIGESYTASNLPFPLAALVFTMSGIWIRSQLPSWKPTKRLMSLLIPPIIMLLVCLLAFPVYFNFWATYISGPAVEFQFRTMDGRTISSMDLKGKVILLDYWDTRCGPCIRLMPHMEIMEAKYSSNPQVVILAVNAGWQDFQAAFSFTNETEHTLNFVYDDDATISRSMGVTELPTVIVINKDFTYHSKHIGYESGKEQEIVGGYIDIIESLL